MDKIEQAEARIKELEKSVRRMAELTASAHREIVYLQGKIEAYKEIEGEKAKEAEGGSIQKAE